MLGPCKGIEQIGAERFRAMCCFDLYSLKDEGLMKKTSVFRAHDVSVHDIHTRKDAGQCKKHETCKSWVCTRYKDNKYKELI